MKKRLSYESVKIIWNLSHRNCVVMILIQLLCSFLPVLLATSDRIFINVIGTERNIVRILFFAGVFVTIYALKQMVQIIYSHYYVTYKLLPFYEKEIKKKLFLKSDHIKLADYDKSELINDSVRAKNASVNLFRIFQSYVEIGGTVLSCILICFGAFFIKWYVALSILLIALSSFIENYAKLKIEEQDLYKKTQIEKEYNINADFIFKASAFKEVKLLNAADFIKGKWNICAVNLLNEKKQKSLKLYITGNLFGIITSLITIASYAILFNSYLKGSIDVSSLSYALISYISISEMITSVFDVTGILAQFIVLVNPFYQYMDRCKKSEETGALKERLNSIKFENVSYRYVSQKRSAVKGISFTVSDGERVAIVGENGAGKSTLIKLIGGLLIPDTGNIFFNDKNVRGIYENDLCRHFTAVPQDINVYPVSFYENMTFGNSEYENLLDGELKSLKLDGKMEHAYDIVGKEFGGIELSGGEKQKMAIIRAKIRKADIVLLDEPTSAIDPLQEADILEKMDELICGKTSVIVSHRLSYTRYADKIIVLKNGEIVEMGAHDELLGKNGEYARLWNLQASGYGLA